MNNNNNIHVLQQQSYYNRAFLQLHKLLPFPSAQRLMLHLELDISLVSTQNRHFKHFHNCISNAEEHISVCNCTLNAPWCAQPVAARIFEVPPSQHWCRCFHPVSAAADAKTSFLSSASSRLLNLSPSFSSTFLTSTTNQSVEPIQPGQFTCAHLEDAVELLRGGLWAWSSNFGLALLCFPISIILHAVKHNTIYLAHWSWPSGLPLTKSWCCHWTDGIGGQLLISILLESFLFLYSFWMLIAMCLVAFYICRHCYKILSISKPIIIYLAPKSGENRGTFVDGPQHQKTITVIKNNNKWQFIIGILCGRKAKTES